MYLTIRSFFYDKKQDVRTKLSRIILLIALLAVFVTVCWGSFIEPELIAIKQTTISLGKTAARENIKIVFLTDIHAGYYTRSGFVEKVVKKVTELNPDLILFGGDYIYGKEENAKYLTPLETLTPTFSGKMFAVTGNHEFNESRFNDPHFLDKTKTLRDIFAQAQIKILDNAGQQILVNGHKLYIAGVSDLWTGQADINKAIANAPADEFKILISHNPDIILEKASENIDLILSGHTHGGQIRWPFIGSIPSIPDQLGRAFDKGLFQLKTGYLYISAGLGETGPRARLFDPPELTVINLDL